MTSLRRLSLDALRFLFVAKGRSNRLTYLGFFIASFLIGNFLIATFSSHGSQSIVGRFQLGAETRLILLYPWLCLAIRRLHDIGLNAVWILSILVLPVLTSIFLIYATMTLPANANDADMRAVGFGGPLMVIFSALASIALFNILLVLTPGQKVVNRFGPAPSKAV